LISFEYDGQGRLFQQNDPVGGSIQYEYGLSGKLNAIHYGTDTRSFTFNYNSTGDLVAVNYPDGSFKQFTYQADGLMTSEIDQRNFWTQFEYNNWFRLKKIIRPDLKTIEFTDSQTTSLANNYVGGQRGQLKGYGEGQLVDGIKDAKNISTTFVKDQTGYVSTIIDGDNRTTLVERDLKGRPTKITRPDNTIVSFTYDQKSGDLLRKSDTATGTEESYVYNVYGDLLSKTDALGRRIINEYDDHGLLSRTINEVLGTSATYSYNERGQLLSQTNSLGQTSVLDYDERGNVEISTNPENKSTSYAYYASGLVQSVTDANNNKTFYEYDPMNRLASVTTAENKKTQYTYWPTGELKDIIDPNGKLTSFEYDVLGQLIKKTGTRNEIVELAYDPNGNVSWEKTPKGDIKQYEYNNLNQLVTKTLPDDVFTFSYDIRGNVETVSNSINQLEFDYQHFDSGDVIKEVRSIPVGTRGDLPPSTVKYIYNDAGEKVQTQTPVGNYSYGRDAAGRLRTLTNNEGKVFNLNYDLTQRLTSISGPSVVTSFEFDSAGFNTKINHTRKSGATIEHFIYGKDLIGNRLTKTTTMGTSSYSYDKQYQLTQAITPVLPQENFVYDEIGNRTQDNNSSYSFDSSKQELREDYKFLYSYDANGNLFSKQEKGFTGNVENFEYTSENQLRRFKLYKNGNLARDVLYSYDALGRRIEKSVSDFEHPEQSFTKRYGYDGQEIFAEYDHENQLLTSYTHSTLRTDDVLSMTNSQGTFYFVKDGLGSVTDITDENGFKVQHYEYTAFGKIARVTDGNGNDVTQNPGVEPYFTYTGREYDKESGLYYYRARYYDANIGRFLQVDPDAGTVSSPLSIVNSYVYVHNNPLNYRDPQGKFLQIAYGALIGAAVSGAVYLAFTNPSKMNLQGFSAAVVGGAVSGAIISLAGPWAKLGLMEAFGWGALAGASGQSASLLFQGEKLTSSRSLTKIGVAAVLGGMAGAGSNGLMSSTRSQVIDPKMSMEADKLINGGTSALEGAAQETGSQATDRAMDFFPKLLPMH
jgi:RHS repeat-associated protein